MVVESSRLFEVSELFGSIVLGAQEVLGQSVKDVHAVHHVSLADGDVELHQLVEVGVCDAERIFKGVDKLADVAEWDVLSGLLVVALPQLVVHVEVVLRESLLHVFGGLRKVFEDDGNVHVDDDEEGNDQVAAKVKNAQGAVATIACWGGGCGKNRTLGRFIVHETCQDAVPASGSAGLEEDDHGVGKGFEVEHVVDACCVLDVHEARHADDGVDEHDEEEEKADVEKGRHRHSQREQQGPDALGRLDQPQNSAHPEHPHYPQQGGRNRQFFEVFLQRHCCRVVRYT